MHGDARLGRPGARADRRVANAPPRQCDLAHRTNLSVGFAGANNEGGEFRSSHDAGRGRRMAVIAGI